VWPNYTRLPHPLPQPIGHCVSDVVTCPCSPCDNDDSFIHHLPSWVTAAAAADDGGVPVSFDPADAAGLRGTRRRRRAVVAVPPLSPPPPPRLPGWRQSTRRRRRRGNSAKRWRPSRIAAAVDRFRERQTDSTDLMSARLSASRKPATRRRHHSGRSDARHDS